MSALANGCRSFQNDSAFSLTARKRTRITAQVSAPFSLFPFGAVAAANGSGAFLKGEFERGVRLKGKRAGAREIGFLEYS